MPADPYPPSPPPPLPPMPPTMPIAPRPGGGMGCFAKGCLVLLAVGLLLLVLGGASTFYGMRKLRDAYTSTRAEPVRTFPATDAQFAEVSARIRAFRDAAAKRQRATLTLSADDLNILVAKDPEYAALRGKVFFSIKDDALFTDVSTPLDTVPAAAALGLKGRWVNGKAGLDLSYGDRQPQLRLLFLEVNGQRAQPAMLASFNSSLQQKLQEDWDRRIRQDRATADAADRVDSLDFKDNKIVLTSVGPEV